MNLTPEIKTLPATTLVGISQRMSLQQFDPIGVWKSFMPRKGELKHIVSTEHYDAVVYDSVDYFKQFDPARVFAKWASVAVSNDSEIPDGMQSVSIPESLYAVFKYKGLSTEVGPTFQYIYNQWIHESEYAIDDRPHLAIMGEKYKNNDPESEEELWIPIKLKD